VHKSRLSGLIVEKSPVKDILMVEKSPVKQEVNDELEESKSAVKNNDFRNALGI
jgi:hypothetical protein